MPIVRGKWLLFRLFGNFEWHWVFSLLGAQFDKEEVKVDGEAGEVCLMEAHEHHIDTTAAPVEFVLKLSRCVGETPSDKCVCTFFARTFTKAFHTLARLGFYSARRHA